MTPEMVAARSAIESLRSGVPSRRAVAQLGTTHTEVKKRFDEGLERLESGEGCPALVFAGNFGAGKSHLLEYLQSVAEQRQFVTSFVVVSPEMPLGNAHLTLKAIAENAQAPGRMGKAAHALAPDFSAPSAFSRLRHWARDADINERFRALLHLYETYRADPEFRTQIVEDFEGKPLLKTAIRQKLKEIGELAAYDLGTQKMALQAHDRIRLLAQLFRVSEGKGLIVLFDEVERIAKFSTNQRFAAYRELGWWAEAASREGSAIFPIFAMTDTFLTDNVLGGRNDARKFSPASFGDEQDERDRQASQGISSLKNYVLLRSAPEQDEDIKYRIKRIYEEAYAMSLPNLRNAGGDVRTTIRSEIRRWITLWDLHRYYPEYTPEVEAEAMAFDMAEISDADIPPDEEETE